MHAFLPITASQVFGRLHLFPLSRLRFCVSFGQTVASTPARPLAQAIASTTFCSVLGTLLVQTHPCALSPQRTLSLPWLRAPLMTTPGFVLLASRSQSSLS